MKMFIVHAFTFLAALWIGAALSPDNSLSFWPPIPKITFDERRVSIACLLEPISIDEENIEAEYDPEKKSKKPSKNNLVWVSDFHSEFFPYKSGEKWLGLFKDGEQFVLRRTKLNVSKLKSPDLFDIEAATESKNESVFLVRGLPYLHESTIPTLFESEIDKENHETLTPTARKFEFNNVTYSLRVENPGGDDFPGKDSKLVLAANEKWQVLRYLSNGYNDCYWSAIWVGDLDLDGKLDFFLDLTDHYNKTNRVLFLSSKADKDKLVKYVADFYSVGC